MNEQELLLTKGKNWATLVAQRADKLCELNENEPDLFIKILSGEIFDKAVEQISLEIKCGLYDKMLMPVEYNK